jgi:hypothetical protein
MGNDDPDEQALLAVRSTDEVEYQDGIDDQSDAAADSSQAGGPAALGSLLTQLRRFRLDRGRLWCPIISFAPTFLLLFVSHLLYWSASAKEQDVTHRCYRSYERTLPSLFGALKLHQGLLSQQRDTKSRLCCVVCTRRVCALYGIPKYELDRVLLDRRKFGLTIGTYVTPFHIPECLRPFPGSPANPHDRTLPAYCFCLRDFNLCGLSPAYDFVGDSYHRWKRPVQRKKKAGKIIAIVAYSLLLPCIAVGWAMLFCLSPLARRLKRLWKAARSVPQSPAVSSIETPTVTVLVRTLTTQSKYPTARGREHAAFILPQSVFHTQLKSDCYLHAGCHE